LLPKQFAIVAAADAAAIRLAWHRGTQFLHLHGPLTANDAPEAGCSAKCLWNPSYNVDLRPPGTEVAKSYLTNH